MERVTLSVMKADVGGFVGHTGMHKDILKRAREFLDKASSKSGIIDHWVGHAGDDLHLVLTHDHGADSKDIHKVAWDTFAVCTEVAERLKLHNPGQDLLASSFPGTLRGAGPGFAEITFRERPSEPVVIFMADKCELGAWNLPLYKIFADPFNTAGLVIDPSMHEGFAFEILDAVENKTITLQCPGDIYDLLMFLGSRGRFVVNKVIRRVDGLVAAAASPPRPAGLGASAGTDDPVLIVRCQNGLPSVGEATEAFSFPHIVSGWLRNTHQGPLMPVAFDDARAMRFDGPPRVAAAGFQLNEGKLEGPVDLFDDPAFEGSRRKAMEIADYLRRHGPFEPHRVPHDQMSNTAFPPLLARMESRFVKNEADEKKRPRKRTAASEENN
ncbi:MAG TPA: fructose 1,6-bisphosphatase [Planctomycetota bacterium]|nr:fructose 1,6-bisphosphatase [Planctomycetota bacterium]